MQGVFGHLVQRYVHSMVPQRPTSALQTVGRSSDFPDGQYEEEYTCRPPAVAMIIISVLEIILFLYDVIEHKALSTCLSMLGKMFYFLVMICAVHSIWSSIYWSK